MEKPFQKLLAIVGIFATLLTAVSVTGGAFYYAGRVQKSIEVVSLAVADHEHRLRDLESTTDDSIACIRIFTKPRSSQEL